MSKRKRKKKFGVAEETKPIFFFCCFFLLNLFTFRGTSPGRAGRRSDSRSTVVNVDFVLETW